LNLRNFHNHSPRVTLSFYQAQLALSTPLEVLARSIGRQQLRV
jgi:hypothetical protein